MYFVLDRRKGFHAWWKDSRLSYVLSAFSVFFARLFGYVNQPKMVVTDEVHDNVITSNIRMIIMAIRLDRNVIKYSGWEA
jgi:hypothetical protein